MFVVYSPDYTLNQRRWRNISRATTVFIPQTMLSAQLIQRRIFSLDKPTGECSWTRLCVSVCVRGLLQIRKSRRPARLWQCGFIRNGKIATPTHWLDLLSFIVFGASVTVDFELTYSMRFGILFKPWACSLFATPATCIPPYCLAVVMPLPQATETVWVW